MYPTITNNVHAYTAARSSLETPLPVQSLYTYDCSAMQGKAGEAGYSTYLRYVTGTIPARWSAMRRKTDMERSKWCRGGLHHPPASEGSA